jgi:hypothetical protein
MLNLNTKAFLAFEMGGSNGRMLVRLNEGVQGSEVRAVWRQAPSAQNRVDLDFAKRLIWRGFVQGFSPLYVI